MTDFVIPAAQAYCAQEAHIFCTQVGTADATWTQERGRALNAVAVLAAQNFAEDGAEQWRIAGPDALGDCEDKALWAARVIDAIDPTLRASMTPMVFRDGDRGHLVLAVFLDRGVFVIDGANYVPRLVARADVADRSGYPGKVYVPRASIAGPWVEWRG